MGELLSKETNQGIEQLTPATAAMSSMMDLQESARLMDGGLERHQHVNVGVCVVILFWEYILLSSPIHYYCS